MTDRDVITRFHEMPDAWLMHLSDGWWAYCGDEKPIGPFNTKSEAARAGLKAWGTAT